MHAGSHAHIPALGRPPAEADLHRYFRVTPPSVHQVLGTIERAELIRRKPGVARNIQLLIDPGPLPPLLPARGQAVKIPVQGYQLRVAGNPPDAFLRWDQTGAAPPIRAASFEKTVRP